jgi:hypothetical protein
MKIRHLLITASLLTGLGAIAQTTPTADAPGPQAGMPHASSMAKMHDMMMKRHAKHLDELKASLKLKPEQESQWTAFANSMQPMQMEHDRMMGADLSKLTTPERIDKMAAFKAQRDAQMQKRAEATKTFYATLSDEQKKTFDQQTAKFMRRMGGEHHGEAGHMMH